MQICYVSAAGRLFLETTSGELLLYIVPNIKLINVEVLCKQVKTVSNIFQYYKHLIRLCT